MSDKPTILVVEDDEDCRNVLQDLLELRGYSVQTCNDARHALEAERLGLPALEKPFDVSRLLELVRSLVPQA